MAESPELHQSIALLASPIGDEASQTDRARAARYLLDHASRAYPELLRQLQSGKGGAVAIIEFLPQFNRQESIPVLAGLLESGDEAIAPVASLALARHQQSDALGALLHALLSTQANTVCAAANALALRGDRSACEALLRLASHHDPRARYHAVQAAGSLNCFTGEGLRLLALTDADADVRHLSERLLRSHCDGAAT